MSSQHMHPKKPFSVVVRLPNIAFKYPSGDTCIRRFQIKFTLSRDFYAALTVLSDVNCPFSESNSTPMPPARSFTASQWHTGSVPPAFHTGDAIVPAYPLSSGPSSATTDTPANPVPSSQEPATGPGNIKSNTPNFLSPEPARPRLILKFVNKSLPTEHSVTPSVNVEPGASHHKPGNEPMVEEDRSSRQVVPPGKRTEELEKYILECIGDDKFLQLCEDVEGVWRRIALGR
ncbi:hypothetical protein BDV25DRAFT_140419 [Aspergillus avenaceus]|uniref:Uncharacterized protein n=1 Tax=Aspergillus avenaceus TaxID=36643 RepID=A0A5N6TU75_ASPAV|nr:hypothetical protein BDV25DRAFT_140419 [Aspergillus avenaceus]